MGPHFRSILGSLGSRRSSRTGERSTPSDPLGGHPPESASVVGRPAAPADGEGDSAREILDLIELELGSMIRRLDRAANSVAGGAEATASTLSTIRQRTDALMERTSAAHATATSFSHAAEKFTLSAHDIAAQVRDARRAVLGASAGLARGRRHASAGSSDGARDGEGKSG